MRTVQFPDPILLAAERLASAGGFASVDAFVANLVDQELSVSEVDNLSGFFTSERLAEIDRAVAEADAVGTLSMDEVESHFSAKRAAWVRK